MKLSFLERTVIYDMLPRESDITNIKIIKKLKDVLGFSEEEIKKHRVKKIPSGPGAFVIHWEDPVEKEIPIGEIDLMVIQDTFRTLNNQKRIKEPWIPVYERFINMKPEDLKGEQNVN